MSELLKVSFVHPFTKEVIEIKLPSEMRFSDVTKLLYDRGFLKQKKGGYQYIVDGHLCVLKEKLKNYAYTGDKLNVMVHGLLTVLA